MILMVGAYISKVTDEYKDLYFLAMSLREDYQKAHEIHQKIKVYIYSF